MAAQHELEALPAHDDMCVGALEGEAADASKAASSVRRSPDAAALLARHQYAGICTGGRLRRAQAAGNVGVDSREVRDAMRDAVDQSAGVMHKTHQDLDIERYGQQIQGSKIHVPGARQESSLRFCVTSLQQLRIRVLDLAATVVYT